jgi:hypothetical protein
MITGTSLPNLGSERKQEETCHFDEKINTMRAKKFIAKKSIIDESAHRGHALQIHSLFHSDSRGSCIRAAASCSFLCHGFTGYEMMES